MRYFYIVDNLKLVRDNASLIRDWEAVGTVEPDVASDRHGVSEVLVAVRHSDHGSMDAWEAIPGVHPMPDPLDTDEITDDHMTKLQRFHPYQLQQQGSPQTPVWMDMSQTPPVRLARKPHTRQMLNDHVSKAFPSFRFRIFH